jgi:hypothetical protein
LGRALVGQLIKKGYMFRIIIELIGNKRVLTNRIDKEGSYLYSFRKSADFCLEEKSAERVSVYKQKRSTGLVSPKVKTTNRDRNIKGTVLQG